MAIDSRGKPLMSTTGAIGQKPNLPKALVMPNQNVQEAPKPKLPQAVKAPSPKTTAPSFSNLKDDDKRLLNIHLTPSFKNVLNKVFGQDMFPEFGIDEPTVSIATSTIVRRFGSIENFMKLVKAEQQDGNNNVPPSRGLMTSPLT